MPILEFNKQIVPRPERIKTHFIPLKPIKKEEPKKESEEEKESMPTAKEIANELWSKFKK